MARRKVRVAHEPKDDVTGALHHLWLGDPSEAFHDIMSGLKYEKSFYNWTECFLWACLIFYMRLRLKKHPISDQLQ